MTAQTIVVCFIFFCVLVLHGMVYFTHEMRHYANERDPFFLKAWRRMMWPVVITYQFLTWGFVVQVVGFVGLICIRLLSKKQYEQLLKSVSENYPLKYIADFYSLLQNPYVVVPFALGLIGLTAWCWTTGYKNWSACVRFCPDKSVGKLLLFTGVFSALFIGSYALYLLIWQDIVFINGLILPVWNFLWTKPV